MKYVRMLRSVGGQGDAATGLATCHVGMDQYLLIPFLGDEHPFTSYFDVNYRGTRF